MGYGRFARAAATASVAPPLLSLNALVLLSASGLRSFFVDGMLVDLLWYLLTTPLVVFVFAVTNTVHASTAMRVCAYQDRLGRLPEQGE
jgi:hypothetical protein